MDHNSDVDFERADADPKLIVSIGVGIAVFVALVPLSIPVFFPQVHQRVEAKPPAISDAAPRLAVHPRDDLARFKGAEEGVLHGYAWIDRDSGIIRIPINHAMEILAKRGPQWPAPTQ